MNLTIQIGRFTRDPEILYGEQQAIKCVKVDIAVPREFSLSDDDPTADFFHCVAFKASAKFIAQTKSDQNEENFHPPDEETPFKD